MENLHKLKTEALMDMLSTGTDAYVRMHFAGATEEEHARCRLLLRAIQKEIDIRIKKGTHIRSSDEETLIG